MGATAISYLKTRFFSLITLLSFYLPGLAPPLKLRRHAVAPSFGEASGYGLVVERLVANQSAGVRFSLPAPEGSTAVVFAHGVGKARVQFPAARKNEK